MSLLFQNIRQGLNPNMTLRREASIAMNMKEVRIIIYNYKSIQNGICSNVKLRQKIALFKDWDCIRDRTMDLGGIGPGLLTTFRTRVRQVSCVWCRTGGGGAGPRAWHLWMFCAWLGRDAGISLSWLCRQYCNWQLLMTIVMWHLQTLEMLISTFA